MPSLQSSAVPRPKHLMDSYGPVCYSEDSERWGALISKDQHKKKSEKRKKIPCDLPKAVGIHLLPLLQSQGCLAGRRGVSKAWHFSRLLQLLHWKTEGKLHQSRIWHVNVKEKPTGKEQTKGIGMEKVPSDLGPREIRKMWAWDWSSSCRFQDGMNKKRSLWKERQTYKNAGPGHAWAQISNKCSEPCSCLAQTSLFLSLQWKKQIAFGSWALASKERVRWGGEKK